MTVRTILAICSTAILGIGIAVCADAPKPAVPTKGSGGDAELVEKVIAVRKEYQASMIALNEYYMKTGDKERAKWVQEELKAYHLGNKPSYRLDISDVPPITLEAKANIKEANDLFVLASSYKGKGYGTEYTLNQRRSEIVLQEILQKHPTSDKIADVAYELGDLYESKAYKQYDRAAAYFERAYQWRKGTRTDARLRAARLYDKQLNERSKAIELYRDVLAHDTEPERIKESEKRLAELTGNRK